MGQKRVGREEWARRVRALEESGEGVTAFARRRGWSAKSLSWWRWKLRQEQPVAFVELAVATEAVSPVEVVLANGRVVRVPATFDAAQLAALLAVVEAA